MRPAYVRVNLGDPAYKEFSDSLALFSRRGVSSKKLLASIIVNTTLIGIAPMRHWLVTLSEDNFIRAIKLGMIGGTLSKLKLYNVMEPGDKLAFYISRKYVQKSLPRISQFVGIGTVRGTIILEDTKVWNAIGSEVYPVRLPVSIEPAKEAVSVKSILSDLDFVAKYRKWPIAFLWTPKEISALDFQKIQRVLF